MTAMPHPFEDLLRCRDWVEAALSYSGDTHDFVHIFDGVVEGRFQFWSNDECCVVTEIVDYPKKRVLHIFLAGGKLEAIRALEEKAVKWAKQLGCSAFTLTGRKGWEKALKNDGWEYAHTSMIKRI